MCDTSIGEHSAFAGVANPWQGREESVMEPETPERFGKTCRILLYV
jgi:hypothetical protein